MGIRTPRLYRKTSGVYFVRVLFGPDHLDASQNGQTKRELRASLRTKDPFVARTLASYINAQLAQCADMTNRQALWPDISHTISSWTLPGGISCNGEEDRRSLTQFLRDHPGLERALAKHIERGTAPLVAAAAIGPPGPIARADAAVGPGGRPSKPHCRRDRGARDRGACDGLLPTAAPPCGSDKDDRGDRKIRLSPTRHRRQHPAHSPGQGVPAARPGWLHVPNPTVGWKQLLPALDQRPAPERLHQQTGEVARKSSRQGQHQEPAGATGRT